MMACPADPEGSLGFLQHLAGHALLAALRRELSVCEGPAPGEPLEGKGGLECSPYTMRGCNYSRMHSRPASCSSPLQKIPDSPNPNKQHRLSSVAVTGNADLPWQELPVAFSASGHERGFFQCQLKGLHDFIDLLLLGLALNKVGLPRQPPSEEEFVTTEYHSALLHCRIDHVPGRDSSLTCKVVDPALS